MTSREETAALIHLQELLASDLSKADESQLVDAVREAELVYDESQRWTGKVIAELRRRKEPPPSWAELSKLTKLAPTTLRNRIAKYEAGPTPRPAPSS